MPQIIRLGQVIVAAAVAIACAFLYVHNLWLPHHIDVANASRVVKIARTWSVIPLGLYVPLIPIAIILTNRVNGLKWDDRSTNRKQVMMYLTIMSLLWITAMVVQVPPHTATAVANQNFILQMMVVGVFVISATVAFNKAMPRVKAFDDEYND